jgi:hypothetical protein
VLERGQLDALERSLPGCELTVVRVTARPETVAARLRARDRGRLLEDFLRRTDSVAEEIKRAALEAFSVANEDRAPPQVAEEILTHLGWIAPR